MQNNKRIVLLIVIFILTAASLYLVYVIQDGSDPLAIFNTRAADETQSTDPGLDNLLAEVAGNPTPTLPYNSTSPSPTPKNLPGGATSPSTTATPSATTAPVLTEKPVTPTAIIEYITVTPMKPQPTAVTSLPVAGITDDLPKYLIGGGLLVLVSIFL